MTPANQLERRAGPAEIRVAGRRLEGLAAPYGVETKIAGFIEKIAKGAFDATLTRGADVLALVDHDVTALLARTRTGTLKLRSADDGLRFAIELAETTLANDVLALAERGDLGGMSFGFTVPDGGERWAGNVRELRQVELREISVIHSWPAYTGTVVNARGLLPTPRRLHLARLWLETCR